MVFHRIGYMSVLHNMHGCTRNALIHWNSGMLFRHRLNVPAILCSNFGLLGNGILPIEPLGRITCSHLPHHQRLTAKFLLLHLRSISCNEISLLFGFRCFPIGRLRTIGECFLQSAHRLIVVIVMLMRKQTSHDGSCPTNTTPTMDIHFVPVTFI